MNSKHIKIVEYLYSHLADHPADIVSLVSRQFGFSRQNVHQYIAREIKDGKITKIGRTRSARYYKVGGETIEFHQKIEPGLAEDQVWSKYIKPMTLNFPDNIKQILAYGFTEIYNNAIDHSDGTTIYSTAKIVERNIEITILDNGIGIFQKIKNALHLDSVRESILHLSKGKFTTDPSKHTGEGIFLHPGSLTDSPSSRVTCTTASKMKTWSSLPKKKRASDRELSSKWSSLLIQKKLRRRSWINIQTRKLALGKLLLPLH